MRVNVHPNLDPFQLEEGQLCVLNEAFNVVEPAGFTSRGEIGTIVELLRRQPRHRARPHGRRARRDDLGAAARETLKAGDAILFDTRTQYAFEKMPKSAVEEVALEEIPDVTYEHIGGLDEQVEILRDAIELPYLHPEVFAEHKLHRRRRASCSTVRRAAARR